MTDTERLHYDQVRILWSLAENLSALDPNDKSALAALIERAKDVVAGKRHKRGNRFAIERARAVSAEKRAEQAKEFRAILMPVIRDLRTKGAKDYGEIAEGLNSLGLKPQRAERWTADKVRRFERSAHP